MTIKIPLSHFNPTVQAAFRSGKLSTLAVRPKIAFHLLRLLRKIEDELGNYEKARISAFKQYGEEYEEGGQQMVRVKPENLESFQAAMKELDATEVSFDFDKLTLADLGDAQLTAQDIWALEPFLEV